MDADRLGVGVSPAIAIELSAAIVTVVDDAPQVLTVAAPGSDLRVLPLGNLDPLAHPTLERGLRGWVSELTGLKLGYVEQLYTFGDRGRDPAAETPDRRLISISYLALTAASLLAGPVDAAWNDWYSFFPWEDWRAGRPNIIKTDILPALEAWIGDGGDAAVRDFRRDRVAMAFGGGRIAWDPSRTLDRYELLYEANMVDESRRVPGNVQCAGKLGQDPIFGQPMARDHRRVLATAISRLRGKLTYRPVVFELMPESFTLLQLQMVVETLAGIRLHKQNFRRLVDRGGLVEPTGKRETRTGGRPAEHYRFRKKVLSERPAPGVGLPERRT
ncbi:MAG TPA: NAD regulator [Alphaproteobacteria bacterium]|jgi:hypothetical protein|nr:NAD regulator [Alphaproteobacteria bacterium]